MKIGLTLTYWENQMIMQKNFVSQEQPLSWKSTKWKVNMMPPSPAQYLNELVRKNTAILLLYLNPMEFAASCMRVRAMNLNLALFNWGLLRTWHVPTTEPQCSVRSLHLQFQCSAERALHFRAAQVPVSAGRSLSYPGFLATLDTYTHLGVPVSGTLFWFFKNSSSPTPGTSPSLQGTHCEMEGWCLSFAFQIQTNRI